jgi:three-Cys-motif partner protein
MAVLEAAVTRDYGPRGDQIDPFFMRKRPWSHTKDEILGKYFDCYLKTIPRRGNSIVVVDGFSGPGSFEDGSDGSPLILCKAASALKTGIVCLFADARAAHRDELKVLLAPYIHTGTAEEPYSNFSEALARAFSVGKNATLFFYLDPYGIRDLDLDLVREIYERDRSQSTEVLINISIRTLMRMSGNWSDEDAPATIAQKVKQSKVETVHRVMGTEVWQQVVTDWRLSKTEREDKLVELYVARLRQFFRYAYAIPVKDTPASGALPTDDVAKYHLIFGTRSPRAVRYMNDVAYNALQTYFAAFTKDFLLDFTPERYETAPDTEIKEAIMQATARRPLTRPDIYEAVIPNYFVHRSTKMYRQLIHELVFQEKRLFPNPKQLKRPNQLNDEVFLSGTPWPQPR